MTRADPVIVNSQTHPIGNGLFSVLCRLRTLVCSTPDFSSSLGHPLDPIYVWADWPSLNQADEREKEIQIPRMGLIYGRAVRVIAWLGDNDDEDELNCRLLMDLARIEVPKCKYDDPWWDEGCQEALFKVMGDRKNYFVNILHSLLVHPFFTRLWIIRR
jgi:hypothetical protein